MWWFWLMVLVVAIWFFLRKTPQSVEVPKRTKRQATRPVERTPQPTISVETSTGHGDEIQIGYEAAGGGGFVIGPALPFPITLYGLDEVEAARLVAAYEGWNEYEIWTWFTHLVAQKNIRCEELEAWVSDAKYQVETAMEERINSSSEWAQISEMDRQDLLTEMRYEVIGALGVRPADVDSAWTLLFEAPHDLTVDDALLARFSGTPETYQLLLRVISAGSKVQAVPADDYRRKSFDELYEKGLMFRGKEIAIEGILMGMTMKQMQDIAGVDAPKKFTRKAQAVEFMKDLPDIWQRLEKSISFRELFQLKPMEDLDVDELARAHAYSSAVASVVMKTIRAAVDNQRLKGSRLDEYVDGWQLHSEGCCPSCQAMHGKTWKRLPKRLPPFHVGCEARLRPIRGTIDV